MVTRTTAKSAWIVPMSSHEKQTGWLSGQATPLEPRFVSDWCECKHRVSNHGMVANMVGEDYPYCRGAYGDECDCAEIRPEPDQARDAPNQSVLSARGDPAPDQLQQCLPLGRSVKIRFALRMTCHHAPITGHQPIPEDRSHCDQGNYCPCRYDDHDLERFWARIRRGYPDECWAWQGTLNAGGYGVITMPGNVQRVAHRLAYTLAGGVLVDGLTLDHLCRNRACVNPDHLEQVTSAENVRRGINWQRGKTHCPRGHAYTPENTITGAPGQGRKCRACAQMWDRERYAPAWSDDASVPDFSKAELEDF